MKIYKIANTEIISPEKANQMIQSIRAGNELSKNKGIIYYETPTGPLVKTKIPLSEFSSKTIEFLKQSTNPERVQSYSSQNITTPIYLVINQKGYLVVSDGGHRILAALQRGDKEIDALVPAGYSKSNTLN